MLANPNLTKLKLIDIFGTNKGGLSNTSLGISEIGITKKISLIEGKDKR